MSDALRPLFDEAGTSPSDEGLREALGAVAPWWDEAVAAALRVPGVTAAWRFYGAKHGWQLKLAGRRRALAYLIPRQGCFTLGAALQPEAVEAVRRSGLPEALVREIEAAKTCAEGRPARVVVTDPEQGAVALELLALKIAAWGSAG